MIFPAATRYSPSFFAIETSFVLVPSKIGWRIIYSGVGYFKDTIRGVSWMGALRASTRGLTFVKIIILARLLSPHEFGLFGIAMLVLAFLEIITETGINIFLIQEKAKLDEYVNTAWAVSIARGFLISLVLFLLISPITSFFSSPDARNILLLTSLIPLIRGFINPSIVKYQKDLLFAKEFSLRFSIFAFDTAIAILFAFQTGSAISLVWGMVAGTILELVLSHLLIKPRPRLEFEITKVKEVVNRGKWVTFAGVFNYLFENVDDAVVGRLLNTTSLGIYQVAYKISSLPITEVSDVVIKVTFPIYSKISGDLDRLKLAFTKTLLGVSAIVFPLGLLLFLFTKQIVLLVLGPKWEEAVIVVKMLAFFGVIRAITNCSYPLLLALKRQKAVSAITLVGILGLSISIVPLVKNFGIEGAAIAALIGSIAAAPVAAYYSLKVFTRNNANY